MSIKVSGGGGGGGGYPGVTGDGGTPGGLNVAGNLQINGPTTLGDPVLGQLLTVNGVAVMAPLHPAASPVLELDQYGGKSVFGHAEVFKIVRQAQGGTVETREMVALSLGDNTTTPDYIHCYSFSGNRDISLSSAGSIGLFSHTPPASQPVLATGAGATVDDVIALLQSYGFCKQA